MHPGRANFGRFSMPPACVRSAQRIPNGRRLSADFQSSDYGFRYLDVISGRWPSRDPIGEKGGVNVYDFVGNEGTDIIDPIGLLYDKGCDWSDRVKDWIKEICPYIKAFSEKDGSDPLVLANSLAEEHADNEFLESAHSTLHDIVNSLFMANSDSGNFMSKKFAPAISIKTTTHSMDTGPANVNSDKAQGVLAARGWENSTENTKWWLHTNEGTVDVGSVLQKRASDATSDIWKRAVTPDEQTELQTNAWRDGEDKFRQVYDKRTQEIGHHVPDSGETNPCCLHKRLEELKEILKGCEKCSIPYR